MASKIIGIILLPIYTKHINIGDFGVFGIFDIISQILPIIALGLPTALQRWLGLKEYQAIRGSILYTSFSFLAVFQFLLLIVVFPIVSFSSYYILSENYNAVILLVFGTVYFYTLNQISTILLRMDERSIYYSISTLIKITVQLLTIIYLITIKNLGFASIFWGDLIGNIVLFILIFPYLLKNFRFKLNLIELKLMIKYGTPTLFSNFSRQIFSFSDRNILLVLSSEAASGIYFFGYRIANIVWVFLVTSFNIALPTLAWSEAGTNSQNRFFAKILTYFSFVLIWASLFLSIYSKGIIHYFAKSEGYWDSIFIIPILLIGFVISGINTILNYGLLITKNTKKMPLILLLSLIINIISNLLLATLWSFKGTAIVFIITALSQLIFTYFFSKKDFKVDWEFGKIFLMFFIASILYLISLLFNDWGLIYRILLKGLIIISFPLILYFLNFYEQIELNTLKNIINKTLRKSRNE